MSVLWAAGVDLGLVQLLALPIPLSNTKSNPLARVYPSYRAPDQ